MSLFAIHRPKFFMREIVVDMVAGKEQKVNINHFRG